MGILYLGKAGDDGGVEVTVMKVWHYYMIQVLGILAMIGLAGCEVDREVTLRKLVCSDREVVSTNIWGDDFHYRYKRDDDGWVSVPKADCVIYYNVAEIPQSQANKFEYEKMLK